MIEYQTVLFGGERANLRKVDEHAVRMMVKTLGGKVLATGYTKLMSILDTESTKERYNLMLTARFESPEVAQHFERTAMERGYGLEGNKIRDIRETETSELATKITPPIK